MGITGLLQDVKAAIEKSHIKNFSGETVGVDGHCWLHKGALDCATELATNQNTDEYVLYFLKCVEKLRTYDIEPFIVFDGETLPLKAETNAKRKEIRMKHLEIGNECEQRSDMKGAAEHYRQAVTITKEMVTDVCKALEKVGVRYIIAPFEADPQLRFLEKNGVVSIVMTEDSDLIVYGCKRIILKWRLFDGSCQLFVSNKLPLCYPNLATPFPFEAFRRSCILSGCDYIPSPHGIGLGKAKDIFLKHPELNITKAIPLITAKARRPLPKDFVTRFKQAEDTFRYYAVIDPKSGHKVPLNPLPIGKKMMPESGNNEKVCEKKKSFRGDIILDSVKKFPSAAAGRAPTEDEKDATSTCSGATVLDNNINRIDSNKDDESAETRGCNVTKSVPSSTCLTHEKVEEKSKNYETKDENIVDGLNIHKTFKVEPELKKRKESCLRVGLPRSNNKITTPIKIALCRQVGLRKTRADKK